MSVLFPWRVLAREQEELLDLNLAHHLHSYALLIYAKMHTTSLDIWLKHHFDVLFIDAKNVLAFQVCYLSFQWNFSKY